MKPFRSWWKGAPMYALFTVLSISFSTPSFAQKEPNNPITYDTTITEKANGEGPFTWQVRITRQQNDNTPRPAFFSMPGSGEVGSDPANLVKYGPHYWLLNGWDGGVQLRNGTHYPILVTIEQPAANMRPWHLKAVLETLLNVLPVKKNSVHVAGLSQGSYEWGELISYAAYSGDQTAMSEIKSWVNLEGVGPGDNFSGYNQAYPAVFGTWATKYGGRFFGLEGTQDSRNIWQITQAMNAVAPNSAYFSYENIGGGGHCCWNSMYDPSVKNWQCVAPVTNANIVPSANPASTMGNYFADPVTGTNIFQWMLRQGDTTMVGTATTTTPPTVNAGSNQSIQLPTSSVTLTGTAAATSGTTLKSTAWAQTSGPSTATIATPAALSSTISGLVAGTYVFSLTATNNAGQSASSTVTVTVLSAAPPPTVSAGSNQSITLPTSNVTLSGSASGNSGATIKTTTWSLASGPNTPTIASASSLSTAVSGLIQGSYSFKLTATDNNNNSSSSTVSVTVNSNSNSGSGTGSGSQKEPNNPITYDTTITEKANGEGPYTWQVRITRQRNDTSLRPAIFTIPSESEIGSDTNNLVKYGPHYWLKNGWDGGVQLRNGTHYPILVTIEQPAANMRPWHTKAVFETLLKILPIRKNSVHVAGIGQGSYEWGELISYSASAGDQTAMSEIKSWVNLEGFGPGDNFSGYNQAFPAVFGTWASKYGGRLFGLEGTQDSRNIWQITQAMNAVAPKSGYFSYENIGGGGHCCWNSMYDPSVKNWQCAAPVTNANIVPSTNPASTMGSYFVDPVTGTNIFQWMLRQGDTSMAGTTVTTTAPTVNAGSNQTIQLPTSSVTLSGTAAATAGTTLKSTTWAQTSGPSTSTIAATSTLSTTVNGLIAGSYVYTLTATNNVGQTASSTVSITVNAAAQPAAPPTVSAGSNLSISLPTSSATLTGTATANGGATIKTTTWSFVSGPNTPTIASPSSLSTSVSGLIQGTYSFKLTVTDNNNNSSSSTASVTVNPQSSSNSGTPSTTLPIIVGTGEYQVFFLDQTRHLYSIGTNLRTLGTNGTGVPGTAIPAAVPSNLTFKSVAAGLHGGAAIDINGNAWAWGDNSMGQAGNGTVTTTEVMTPTQIMTDASGSAFTGIAQLSAFYSGNASDGWYAVKADGTLWVWGQTLGGMKGDGTTGSTAQTRPVQVPVPGGRKVAQVASGNILIVLCTDGTVWTCGGTNTNPQNLGYAVSANSYLSLQQLPGLSSIVQVAGGGSFNYALRADGTLFGWGYYGYYMGGTGGTNTPLATPTDLTTRLNLPHPVKMITTNMVCTHAILTDGTLWGWGDNAQGGMGIGTELDYSKTAAPYSWDWNAADLLQQSPVQITSRNDFVAIFETQPFVMYTYAETAGGQLYSWGRNKTAVLGNGVVGCSPDVVATYPNSWDVPLATLVTPLSVTSTKVVPCPYCTINPTTSPCNACAITKATASVDSSKFAASALMTPDIAGHVPDQLLVYPTITQGRLNVHLTSDYNGSVLIRIFDINGRPVQLQRLDKENSSLDELFSVSGLAAGMYFIEAVMGSKKPMTTKFIKQ